MNVINRFNNSINNLTERITYFKDENRKSKEKYKNYEVLSTILKTVDTCVTNSISVTLSMTGFGLKGLPISTGNACGLMLTNEGLHEIIMNFFSI